MFGLSTNAARLGMAALKGLAGTVLALGLKASIASAAPVTETAHFFLDFIYTDYPVAGPGQIYNDPETRANFSSTGDIWSAFESIYSLAPYRDLKLHLDGSQPFTLTKVTIGKQTEPDLILSVIGEYEGNQVVAANVSISGPARVIYEIDVLPLVPFGGVSYTLAALGGEEFWWISATYTYEGAPGGGSDPVEIPVPASALLLVTALAGLGAARWRGVLLITAFAVGLSTLGVTGTARAQTPATDTSGKAGANPMLGSWSNRGGTFTLEISESVASVYFSNNTCGSSAVQQVAGLKMSGDQISFSFDAGRTCGNANAQFAYVEGRLTGKVTLSAFGQSVNQTLQRSQ